MRDGSTYKAARVVVAHRFGVTEGLQERIRFEDDVFDSSDTFSAAGNAGDVVHYVFGFDRLASSGFAAIDRSQKNQIKSNQIKSNQIKSNQIRPIRFHKSRP